MIIQLAQAGYREKVYVKLMLARGGLLSHFAWALRNWRYDPERDEILDDKGSLWTVSLEGSGSREELARYGADDSGC